MSKVRGSLVSLVAGGVRPAAASPEYSFDFGPAKYAFHATQWSENNRIAESFDVFSSMNFHGPKAASAQVLMSWDRAYF
jgi:hypothetical protein